MKVLLVNPPEQHTIQANLPGAVEDLRGVMPPISLMCVAAVIRNTGRHSVSILDTCALALTCDDLESEIKKSRPDVVGFSVTSFTLLDNMEAARRVRNVSPKATIIAGGIQPFIYPEQTAKLNIFDYCFSGEVDLTLPLFLDALEDGRSPEDIPGINYVKDGVYVSTPPATPVKDLDALPFPAHDLIPFDRYTSLVTDQHPISIMITSRGCPYRCAFCSRSAIGKAHRCRRPESIADEMAWCEKLGIRYLLIYDEVMTISEKRVMALCDLILKRGIKIKWMARARAETLTTNMLTAMKQAGCDLVTVGVESGSPRILKRLNRPTDIDALIAAFQMIHRVGLRSLAYFMVGCPDEEKKDLQASLAVAKQAAPDMIHASVFVPYPATALYREGLTSGRFDHDYWKDFAQIPSVNFRPRLWVGPDREEEITNRLAWFYHRFYLRPGYILRRLLRLKGKQDLVTNLRGLIVLFSSRRWFSSANNAANNNQKESCG